MDIASYISKVFHPIAVTLSTLIIASYLMTSRVEGAFFWIGSSAVVILGPLVAYYTLGMRNGGYEGKDDRRKIYALGLGLAALYTGYAYLSGAPDFIFRFAAAVITTGALFTVINLRTKISVHTGAFSGSAAVLALLEPLLGAAGFLILPAVGWARIKLEEHTPFQALLGSILPPLVFGLVFWLGSS
jgi:hypothetical protein